MTRGEEGERGRGGEKERNWLIGDIAAVMARNAP